MGEPGERLGWPVQRPSSEARKLHAGIGCADDNASFSRENRRPVFDPCGALVVHLLK